MVLIYRHMALAVASLYTIMAIFEKGSLVMTVGFAIGMLCAYFSLLVADLIVGSPCFFIKPRRKILVN